MLLSTTMRSLEDQRTQTYTPHARFPFAMRWGLALACVLLLTLLGVLAPSTHAAASTYYVNCSAASNGNGSQGNPWNTLSSVNATTFQPGDSILFHSGTDCTGQLHPGGSGNSLATITIGTDASGTARIDGNGVSNGAVYLYNQQYWDINNLEITNTASGGSALNGVYVIAQDSGTISHIHLSNLQIHDVTGGVNSYTSGGIVFQVTGSSTATHFDDVLVQNCMVHDITSFGIMTWTSWSNRLASNFGSSPYTPETNVRIQQNTVYNTGGDGISLFGDASALAQNNIVHDTGQRENGLGIEINDGDNDTAQFNEVYHSSGNLDGEAFDCDVSAHNCTIQYNYTHDDPQGFVLIMGGENHNPIVRYNISQNDSRGVVNLGPHFGSIDNAQIYDNTFYVNSSLSTNILNTYGQLDTGNSFTMTNNVVENLGSGGYSYPTDTSGSWDHNLFYGNHPSSEPSDANKLTSNPLLVSPGGAGMGTSTTNAYQLQTGSPAIGSGIAISNNGGRDFFGNPVSGAAPNRGAYNGSGINTTANLALNGTYSSSSNYDNNQTASKAFDGNYATDWQAAFGHFVGEWLAVTFPSNTTFDEVKLTEYGNRTQGFLIQYWNGSSWQTAYTGTTIGATGVTATFTFPAVTGSAARISFTAGGPYQPIIYEFEIYNDLALNGTYSSSSNYDSNQTAAKAFDANYSTDWQAASGHFVGEWLAVTFPSNTTFDEVKLTEYGNRTQGFLIQYWNGSSWQTAFTGTTIGASGVTNTFTFPAVTGSAARISFTAGGPYQPIIYEFEIYNV